MRNKEFFPVYSFTSFSEFFPELGFKTSMFSLWLLKFSLIIFVDLSEFLIKFRTNKGKALTMQCKSWSDERLSKSIGHVSQLFFVGGPWIQKYKFSKSPAAVFFLFFTVKHFKKISKIMKNLDNNVLWNS